MNLMFLSSMRGDKNITNYAETSNYTVTFMFLGYWRQRADERLDDPLPSYPGAFNGQRQG